MLRYVCVAAALAAAVPALAQDTTYAERLGFPEGARVVIFHNDDAGMSHESNLGTIEGIEYGIMTSCSTMMPCSWVPDWNAYLKEHPEVDNGLHLTLTSEWGRYRWGPVAGRDRVPGLVDDEGYLHKSVQAVIANATADEVETEIRAQIALAEKMGMPITHIDSHMGTLFYHPPFFERYVKVGIEKGLPILVMSGYGRAGTAPQALIDQLNKAADMVWNAGLPVIDDLKTSTADTSDADVMIAACIESLKNLKPGITQIILHGTRPNENWKAISSSGGKREAELEMVLSPDVKRVIEEEGIILTTWKELKERRATAN